jgi:hypothetical protein
MACLTSGCCSPEHPLLLNTSTGLEQQERMTTLRRTLATITIGLATALSYAQWQQPTDSVPAYYKQPPSSSSAGGLILAGKQLAGAHFKYPFQVAAYKKAAQVQSLLYQLPCYCRCDRAEGHKSLHSCFEGTHGASCTTCMKEVVYAYDMSRKGKLIREIRAGIEHGDWLDVGIDEQSGN